MDGGGVLVRAKGQESQGLVVVRQGQDVPVRRRGRRDHAVREAQAVPRDHHLQLYKSSSVTFAFVLLGRFLM